MARDLYQNITDRIVSQLEAGTVPWVRPFSQRKGQSLPCNAITNRPYSGVNVLLLFTSMALAYPTNRFLTFKQAKDVGGFVKKGEKGHTVVFFKKLMVKDKQTGEDKTIPLIREFTVFNVVQCENLPDHVRLGRHEDVVVKNESERMEEADAFIQTWGANFREGPQAMYVPSQDFIFSPPWKDYRNHVAYYATLFHEGAHWTGHKSRLNRDLKNRFGTAEYAAEELIAELAAAFLCAEFGFDVVDNSAAYISSWIKMLKEDPKAIVTAASQAQKAADFLRGKALYETETNNEVEREAA